MKIVYILSFLIASSIQLDFQDGCLFATSPFYVDVHVHEASLFMRNTIDGVVTNIIQKLPDADNSLESLTQEFKDIIENSEVNNPKKFYLKISNFGAGPDDEQGTILKKCKKIKINENSKIYVRVRNYNWEKDFGYITKLMNNPHRIMAFTCRHFRDENKNRIFTINQKYWKTGFIVVYDDLPSEQDAEGNSYNPVDFATYQTYIARALRYRKIQRFNFNKPEEEQGCPSFDKCVRETDPNDSTKKLKGTSTYEVLGRLSPVEPFDYLESQKSCNIYSQWDICLNNTTFGIFWITRGETCCPIFPEGKHAAFLELM